ncbi:MAG: rod shape-determining protein MreC [Candidatus Levybacteria bacterium]|nr:rod shape-determining protein MreC [Candidatus Levybacteria bacterium]
MKRREGFLPAFFAVAFLSIVILVLSLSGKLKFLSFLEKPAAGIQSLSYNLFQKLPFVSQDSRIKKLQDENLGLLSRLAAFEKLKKENAALSDQFQTFYPSSVKLLKANVIGAPGFIPGVSFPNIFILNKGSTDNVRAGQAVVVKNNLVGTVVRVSENLSKVNTVNNSSSFFTAKTQSGAVGVVNGGTNITLNNVLLSENLKKGELVLTKGDIDFEGVYAPPDLVIGKIASVEKSASDLFQKAKVESSVDFSKLSTVFVYINSK